MSDIDRPLIIWPIDSMTLIYAERFHLLITPPQQIPCHMYTDYICIQYAYAPYIHRPSVNREEQSTTIESFRTDDPIRDFQTNIIISYL